MENLYQSIMQTKELADEPVKYWTFEVEGDGEMIPSELNSKFFAARDELEALIKAENYAVGVGNPFLMRVLEEYFNEEITKEGVVEDLFLSLASYGASLFSEELYTHDWNFKQVKTVYDLGHIKFDKDLPLAKGMRKDLAEAENTSQEAKMYWTFKPHDYLIPEEIGTSLEGVFFLAKTLEGVIEQIEVYTRENLNLSWIGLVLQKQGLSSIASLKKLLRIVKKNKFFLSFEALEIIP